MEMKTSHSDMSPSNSQNIAQWCTISASRCNSHNNIQISTSLYLT